MIRSLNTARDAMQQEQMRIDALANNLANVNTAGFRQVLTRVAENGTLGADAQTTGGTAQTAGQARSRATGDDPWTRDLQTTMYHAVDMRRGTLRSTGRDTDVALMDRGFFVVQDPAGERYTRDGSFRLDAERRLTTPDGRIVLGTGGPLTIAGDDFSIERDGTVIVDGAPAGNLRVVDFDDPSRLEHLGGSLLAAPEDMPAQPVPREEIIVAQGHLEGSNVDPVDTLVAMITAQRAFEMQSQVMTTEDEMLNKSVNNLPRVGQ